MLQLELTLTGRYPAWLPWRRCCTHTCNFGGNKNFTLQDEWLASLDSSRLRINVHVWVRYRDCLRYSSARIGGNCKWAQEKESCLKLKPIFSSAWLRQQSSWYGISLRRPSSPSTACIAITSEPVKCIPSNFGCRLPWKWFRVKTDNFEQKKTCFLIFFNDFLNCWLTLDPMRTNISIRYSSPKFLLYFFKHLLNFFSIVLTKVLVWIFEILRI